MDKIYAVIYASSTSTGFDVAHNVIMCTNVHEVARQFKDILPSRYTLTKYTVGQQPVLLENEKLYETIRSWGNDEDMICIEVMDHMAMVLQRFVFQIFGDH